MFIICIICDQLQIFNPSCQTSQKLCTHVYLYNFLRKLVSWFSEDINCFLNYYLDYKDCIPEKWVLKHLSYEGFLDKRYSFHSKYFVVLLFCIIKVMKCITELYYMKKSSGN